MKPALTALGVLLLLTSRLHGQNENASRWIADQSFQKVQYGDHATYHLKLKPTDTGVVFTATLTLLRDGRRIMGRIPLRQMDDGPTNAWIRFTVGCLHNDLLKAYEAETEIGVTVRHNEWNRSDLVLFPLRDATRTGHAASTGDQIRIESNEESAEQKSRAYR